MDVTPPPADSGIMVGVRPRAEVEALVTRLEGMWQQHPQLRTEFTQGVVDTARWGLGRGPAPVSGAIEPAGPDALREEDDRAHELIYDAAAWGQRPQRKDWAVGVQHTAMWLRGATDSRPGFG